MGERENDSQLVEARAIWDINGAKWSTSPVVINVFWNQQQFIDTKTNKQKKTEIISYSGEALLFEWRATSSPCRCGGDIITTIWLNETINQEVLIWLQRRSTWMHARWGCWFWAREREREGDELIYIIARVWGSERDNNKYMMERSDFWLCAEEKLSETRPRKIRARARAGGKKLKDLFDRVRLGDWWSLTEMPLEGSFLF